MKLAATFLILLLSLNVAFASVTPTKFGGTGHSSFTSNTPLIGNGSSAISQGTVSGNTTKFATVSGSLTSTHCVNIDANGNLTDAGAACGSGGSATAVQEVPTGTCPTSTITLGFTPTSNASVQFYLDGVLMYQSSEYTVSTNVITLASPCTAGQLPYAIYTK